jgi:hypothetical protein
VRFAYADPPYLGKCGKFYEHNHPDGRCWDDLETHRLLIEKLVTEYPEGWALSLSSSTLWQILPMCPEDVRIAAWVKTFCVFKPHVRPAYAWEPVIFWRGRNPSGGHPWNPPPMPKGSPQFTPKDFIAERITLRKGLTGAKPEAVCQWILDLLNYQPGDEMHDLFPGTGIMGDVSDRRAA